ncbi:hypothetical protein MKX03_000908, partial [Papaver bracteatum]
IAAGTPEDYYLDPSENLWKISYSWEVVELQDHIVLSVNLLSIGDRVLVAPHEDDVIRIAVLKENKEKAARFDHIQGMKYFTIKINKKFLKIDDKDDATYKRIPDATAVLFMKKL